jgi:hypothetical protein
MCDVVINTEFEKKSVRQIVLAVLPFAILFQFVSFAAGAEKLPFYPDDSLAVVREKIKANGYHFTVASNWVVKLPPARREQLRGRRNFGRPVRIESEEVFDPGPVAAYLASPVPVHFDWRNVNGHSYIGPIRRQGNCGACYAFGACAAAEGVYNRVAGLRDADCIDFSEAFIIFCLDDLYPGFSGCRGSDYEYDELNALVESGVCHEARFPYDSGLRECRPDFSPPTIRFFAWYRLPCNNVAAIKAAIYYCGVVDVALLTNPAFDAYQSGIYEDTRTSCDDQEEDYCYYAKTDHVAALVGWDDNDGDGYWILRNSWGREWGEDGYMRISFRAAHVACAACYLLYSDDVPGAPPLEIPKISGWLPLLLKK